MKGSGLCISLSGPINQSLVEHFLLMPIHSSVILPTRKAKQYMLLCSENVIAQYGPELIIVAVHTLRFWALRLLRFYDKCKNAEEGSFDLTNATWV